MPIAMRALLRLLAVALVSLPAAARDPISDLKNELGKVQKEADKFKREAEQARGNLDKLQKEANNAKGELGKANERAKALQKQLDAEKAKALEAAKKGAQAAGRALTGAAKELHDCLQAAHLPDPLKAATDPVGTVKELLARAQQAEAKALRTLASSPPALQVSIDKSGAATLKVQAPKVDVKGKLERMAQGLERLAAVEPAAACLAKRLRGELGALAAVLEPQVQAMAQQAAAAMEPLAEQAAAKLIDLALDGLGSALDDKDLKATMKGILVENLLAPKHLEEIAAALDGYGKALAQRQQVPAKADAATAALKLQWQPGSALLVRLAVPAVRAGAKLGADKLIHAIGPNVYDAAMAPMLQGVDKVAEVVVEELCALGDVATEWACAIAAAIVEDVLDTLVKTARPIAIDLVTLAAKAGIDAAIDKLAPEAEKLIASEADPRGKDAALKLLGGPKKARLEGVLKATLTKVTGPEIQATLAALAKYNAASVAVVTASRGLVR